MELTNDQIMQYGSGVAAKFDAICVSFGWGDHTENGVRSRQIRFTCVRLGDSAKAFDVWVHPEEIGMPEEHERHE